VKTHSPLFHKRAKRWQDAIAHRLRGRPDDTHEKKRIGDLWARRSEGHCKFMWVGNKNWQAIKDALK
jgi:hypothetical protein